MTDVLPVHQWYKFGVGPTCTYPAKRSLTCKFDAVPRKAKPHNDTAKHRIFSYPSFFLTLLKSTKAFSDIDLMTLTFSKAQAQSCLQGAHLQTDGWRDGHVTLLPGDN